MPKITLANLLPCCFHEKSKERAQAKVRNSNTLDEEACKDVVPSGLNSDRRGSFKDHQQHQVDLEDDPYSEIVLTEDDTQKAAHNRKRPPPPQIPTKPKVKLDSFDKATVKQNAAANNNRSSDVVEPCVYAELDKTVWKIDVEPDLPPKKFDNHHSGSNHDSTVNQDDSCVEYTEIIQS